MSALWRSAVDWHATTLSPAHSLILSLIADAANDVGEAKPNIEAVAWQARTNPREVRKAIEAFIETGLAARARGVLILSTILLGCHFGCPCPWSKAGKPRTAPGTTQPTPDTLGAVQTPANLTTRRGFLAEGDLEGVPTLTIALEVLWRQAYKTEPAPGLLRKMARDQAFHGSSPAAVAHAFGEYLRRIKDPMFLNLPKFASTWRAYLEPQKGAGKTEDAFAKVFSPFERDVIAAAKEADL